MVVVPSLTANAVAGMGGSVLLFSGLIEKLDGDEHALAWVLAHEHSHLLGRHSAEHLLRHLLHSAGINLAAGLAGLAVGRWREVQLERARREDQARRRRRPLLLRWLPAVPRREHAVQRSTAQLVDESNVAVQMGLHVASFLALKALSRRFELEADKVGLCLARDAGKRVHATSQGALTALDKFDTQIPLLSALEAAATPLSTHPTPATRRKALQGAVAAGLP